MSDTYTYSTEGPQCPYCNRQFTADDSIYYDEMNYTSDTCDECDKKFSVRVYTSVSWTCEPIEVAETRSNVPEDVRLVSGAASESPRSTGEA